MAFCAWPPPTVGPSVTYQLFTPSSQSISPTAAGCSQRARVTKWLWGLTVRMCHPSSVTTLTAANQRPAGEQGHRLHELERGSAGACESLKQDLNKQKRRADLAQRTKPQKHGTLPSRPAQDILIINPWVTLMPGFFLMLIYSYSFHFIF